MEHADHVALIRDGVVPGTTWLELGSGTGAFTLALAELVGAEGSIRSVDRDRAALADQARSVGSRFPAVPFEHQVADFTQPLDGARVHGVLMANSLHFIRDKAAVLALVRGYLISGGTLVLVEYDVDRGNHWVPHPLSFRTWEATAAAAGFSGTRLLGRVPSRFLGAMYSAASSA